MGLDAGKPVLLVTGASQGAGSINEMMTAFVKRRPEALRGWQVIHQTGKVGVEAVRAAYAEAGVPAVVEGFFREMGRAWRAAECAVSRAGAGRLERDAIGAEANLARAGVALGEMLTDAACRNGMRKCFESLGPADGARRVADAILHENRGISGTSR
jgi:UDP-N-acetylglucosamine:LPS N-acetylglucosamine transferase